MMKGLLPAFDSSILKKDLPGLYLVKVHILFYVYDYQISTVTVTEL